MASEYYQKHTVPPQFPLILRNFTREILRLQPKNIVEFSAKYFRSLVNKTHFTWDESKSRGPLPCDYPRVNLPKNLKTLATTDQPQPYMAKKGALPTSAGKTAMHEETKTKQTKAQVTESGHKPVQHVEKPSYQEKHVTDKEKHVAVHDSADKRAHEEKPSHEPPHSHEEHKPVETHPPISHGEHKAEITPSHEPVHSHEELKSEVHHAPEPTHSHEGVKAEVHPPDSTHSHEEAKAQSHPHEPIHSHEEAKTETHQDKGEEHQHPAHVHKPSVEHGPRDALNISGNMSLPSNPEEAAESYVENLIERGEASLVQT